MSTPTVTLVHSSGTLTIPCPSIESDAEVDVNQDDNRAPGHGIAAYDHGAVRYRLQRKFEGLRDTEAANLNSFLTNVQVQGEPFIYVQRWPGHPGLSRVFQRVYLTGNPKGTKKSHNHWDFDLTFEFDEPPTIENADAGYALVSIPIFTSADFCITEIGDAVSYTATAVGAGPITFTTGTLPGWLGFASGTFSGTPDSDDFGAYLVQVTATGAQGTTILWVLFIVIAPVPALPSITSSLANLYLLAEVDDASYQITATGDPTIEFDALDLPDYLAIDGDGLITGSPQIIDAGETTVKLVALNPIGPDVEEKVFAVLLIPTLTSEDEATGYEGYPFSYTIEVEGTPPYEFEIDDSPPAWLTCDPDTGEISGTVPADGMDDSPYVFTIRATSPNHAGATDEWEFTLTVEEPAPPVITSTLTASGFNTVPFSYTITATGNPPPTFSISGAPGWLTCNPTTGVVSGTPPSGAHTSSPYSFTIQGDNIDGTDSETLVVTIAAPTPPSITSDLDIYPVLDGFSEGTYTATASGTAPITFVYDQDVDSLLTQGFSVDGPDLSWAFLSDPDLEDDFTLRLRAFGPESNVDTETLNIHPGFPPYLDTDTFNVAEGGSVPVDMDDYATGTGPRTYTLEDGPAFCSIVGDTLTISPGIGDADTYFLEIKLTTNWGESTQFFWLNVYV